VITQEFPQFNEEQLAQIRHAELDYPLEEGDLEKYFDPPSGRPKRTVSHLDIGGHRDDTPQVLSRESADGRGGPSTMRADLKALEKANEELFARVFEEMA
jgi:hypothetical protein